MPPRERFLKYLSTVTGSLIVFSTGSLLMTRILPPSMIEGLFITLILPSPKIDFFQTRILLGSRTVGLLLTTLILPLSMTESDIQLKIEKKCLPLFIRLKGVHEMRNPLISSSPCFTALFWSTISTEQ